MHIFNRIMMTIGSLCLVLGSSTLFLITIGINAPQDWLPAPWHEVLVPFTQLDRSQRLSVISICLGVLIVGMLLVFVELRSRSTKVPALILKKDDLGQIAASMTSIQDLANREAGTIKGVKESLTHVKNTSEASIFNAVSALPRMQMRHNLANWYKNESKLRSKTIGENPSPG
jgi:hypothetical protein